MADWKPAPVRRFAALYAVMTRPWFLRAYLLGAAAIALTLFWWCLRDGNDLFATVNLGTLAWALVGYARLDRALAEEKHLLMHLEAMRRAIKPGGEEYRWR